MTAQSYVPCTLCALFMSSVESNYLCVCAGGLVTLFWLGHSIALLHTALNWDWLAPRHLMSTKSTMLDTVALQTLSSYMLTRWVGPRGCWLDRQGRAINQMSVSMRLTWCRWIQRVSHACMPLLRAHLVNSYKRVAIACRSWPHSDTCLFVLCTPVFCIQLFHISTCIC